MFIEFLRVLFCEMIFGVEMAAATEPLAGRPWRRVGALDLDPRCLGMGPRLDARGVWALGCWAMCGHKSTIGPRL